MAQPRKCPRCNAWMSEDEHGWWCDTDGCDYEVVVVSHQIKGGD
jgi:hypothetical protein